MSQKPQPHEAVAQPPNNVLATKLAAHLGPKLRAAREQQGLTRACVAADIGLAYEVYGRMERGRMLPSVPTLWRVCTRLRVSTDVVLGLEHAARDALTVAAGGEPSLSSAPPGAPQPPAVLLGMVLRAASSLDSRRLRLLYRFAVLLRADAPIRGGSHGPAAR